MIIIISSEENFPDEAEIVNQLFQEGLDLFHVRKPFINNQEMKDFLGLIDKAFCSQLVLHSHFELAKQYGISRLHCREEDRMNGLYEKYVESYIMSTSVHDINSFNTLGSEWEYAFLSPFFPSISKKGYGIEATILEESKERYNQDVKLIALGGINEKNVFEVLNTKVDGIALLGVVWQSDHPVETFKNCKNEMVNYVQNKKVFENQ